VDDCTTIIQTLSSITGSDDWGGATYDSELNY